MKIGVIGFSQPQFDQVTARELLRSELERLAAKYSPGDTEIVSGYTNQGVPRLAYEEARKLGFQLVGFSVEQALRVRAGVFPVDKVILHGQRFGDESQAFVNYIDGLIRVGGGQQSHREANLFRNRFQDGTLGRRLKEFEVQWYGKKTVQQGTVPPKGSEEVITLADGATISMFRGVEPLKINDEAFKQLWESHPADYHTVMMHGKAVKTPRWQQAYGKNYQYSGSRNNALPISQELLPYLRWCKMNVDERLNGLLLNWYDGALNHYIGPHRDSITGLLPNSPIVTISLGQERIFRLRPYGGKGFTDLTLTHGDVLVIPSATNQQWTHEVPKFKLFTEKRISVTLRAYE